jgi:hypothetical protein
MNDGVDSYIGRVQQIPARSASDEVLLVSQLQERPSRARREAFAEPYLRVAAARALSYCRERGINRDRGASAIHAANVGLMLAVRDLPRLGADSFAEFASSYPEQALNDWLVNR